MSDDSAKKTCGCNGGSCCSGLNKWIWIILALAVAGVLIAKHAAKKEVAPVAPTVSQTPALPRLVDLGAGKCIPCKLMAPILEDLKKTYARKLDVQFIDVWEDPEAGKKFGINLIPTQIFYDAQNKELFRHEGFFSKEDILAKWKEFGVDLNKNSESRSQNPE
ncbi:MAG: thioredoxin family protein [bacterium]